MKKYLSIYILVLLALTTGCDDYLDVNTDPNRPTTATPDLLLPVAQNYTARYMLTDRGANCLGNLFMYNWSESGGFSWYNDEFLYLVNSTSFYQQLFNNAYLLSLKQYESMHDLDTETYPAYVGISKVMKAYHYQLLVDFYDEVPYSNALERRNNPTPTYDQGAAIYDSLMIELTDAIALFQKGEDDPLSVNPAADDVMFGGDLTMWKQLANTIKLRILTRELDVKDAGYVTAELAKITNEGSGYITADVAVAAPYSNNENKQSPYWEDYGKDVSGTETLTNKATCASDYILSYLAGTGDLRLNRLYELPPTGNLGVPQGITADPVIFSFQNVSNIGPGLLKSAQQPAIILTLAESYFNQAELALKGFGGDPKALYENGVTASYVTLGLTAADATSYMAPTVKNVNYDSSPDKLEAIITQKWIAMNGLTAEQSWFDWSRTGFPLNLPVSIEAPNLIRPVRLTWPASEAGQNSLNIPAKVDAVTTNVFWAN